MDGRTIGAKVAAHQRDVALAAVHLALVGDHAEFAVAGLDAALAGAHNVALVAQPVADQLSDSKNPQPVFLAEGNEIRDAGHRSVVLHDLADHARWIEASHPRQIHRGLGLSGAYKHAPPAGSQRKYVAGTSQV